MHGVTAHLIPTQDLPNQPTNPQIPGFAFLIGEFHRDKTQPNLNTLMLSLRQIQTLNIMPILRQKIYL